MKRLFSNRFVSLVTVALLLSAVLVLGIGSVTHAQSFRTDVPKAAVIDSSVYARGKTVTIDGTVNGDVYCAGQVVNITGTVHGDVLCVGQTITVSGTIDGSVRLAGQNVSVSGSIGQSASIAAATLTLEKSATVGRDATLFGASSSVAGAVNRDLVANSGLTTISGTIGRNVKSTSGQLSLASPGHIKGSVEYSSSQAADLSGGKVDGKVTHTQPVVAKHRIFGFGWAAFWYLLGAGLLVALLFVLIAPQEFNGLAAYPSKRLGKTVVTGLLGGLAIPALATILFITVLGIPLGIFLLLADAVLAILAGPVAAYYVGSMVLAKSHNAIAIMLVGAAILLILLLVPVIGGLVLIVSYWIGLGSLLLRMRDAYKKPDYRIS